MPNITIENMLVTTLQIIHHSHLHIASDCMKQILFQTLNIQWSVTS